MFLTLLHDITGGRGFKLLFFCEPPGCAANVEVVYCNDKNVFAVLNETIKDCSGFPPPNTVCQRDGRAFVSTNSDGQCDFEGLNYSITTIKCEGIQYYFSIFLSYLF